VGVHDHLIHTEEDVGELLHAHLLSGKFADLKGLSAELDLTRNRDACHKGKRRKGNEQTRPREGCDVTAEEILEEVTHAGSLMRSS